jgi:hypothetical protein
MPGFHILLVIIIEIQRQFAKPLKPVQLKYLKALGVMKKNYLYFIRLGPLWQDSIIYPRPGFIPPKCRALKFHGVLLADLAGIRVVIWDLDQDKRKPCKG